MARPKIEIDPAEVEKLASFGCSNVEIAAMLGCTEGTIRRRFYENLAKGRGNLKKSLRRKQTEIALGGNVTMLIWLGKNMLGQADKQEVENSGTTTIRVEYVDGATAKIASGAGDDQDAG